MPKVNPVRKILTTIALALPMLGAVLWGRASSETNWIAPEIYHQKVTEAVTHLPEKIGSMKATKAELPPAGTEILKPNAEDARLFVNLATSEGAIVDFVQSKDARSLVGHYPPICYIANGWQAIGSRPVNLEVEGKKIQLIEYGFTRYDDKNGMVNLYALDLMILPGADLTTDMNVVGKRGSDFRRKYYGAAQIQIVFNFDQGPEFRDAVAQKLLVGYMPLIHTVIDGVKP